MNQPVGVPEYILEESEKIHLTVRQLDSFVQRLTMVEEKLVLLLGEVNLLTAILKDTIVSEQEWRQSVLEQV